MKAAVTIRLMPPDRHIGVRMVFSFRLPAIGAEAASPPPPKNSERTRMIPAERRLLQLVGPPTSSDHKQKAHNRNKQLPHFLCRKCRTPFLPSHLPVRKGEQWWRRVMTQLLVSWERHLRRGINSLQRGLPLLKWSLLGL